jgi:hypothetical protein
MLRENYVAKQQRIGERLSRAMAKARMDRRELALRKFTLQAAYPIDGIG